MKKTLSLICIFICLSEMVSAKQIKRNGAFNLLLKDKRFFYQHEVSLYAMPSLTSLLFKDIDGIRNTYDWTCGVGMDYRLFVHQNIGFSVGLQLLPYTSGYDFNNLTLTEFGYTDPDAQSGRYEYRSRYDVKESMSVYYFELPFKFLITSPSWNKVQFRMSLGYCFGSNISAKGKLNGQYSNTLHYIGYDILDEYEVTDDIREQFDIDALKLGTRTDMQVHNPSKQLRAHHSVLAELGIGIKLHKRIQLNLDIYGAYSLNNVQKDRFQFNGMNKTYKGVLSTSLIQNGIHPLSLGVRAGLSVYLGKERAEKLPDWKKRKLENIQENSDFLANIQRMNELFEENVNFLDESGGSDTVYSDNSIVEQKSDSVTNKKSNGTTEAYFSYHIKSTEILFYMNTTEILETSQLQLLDILRDLRTNKPKKIVIIGHTCNLGSNESNIKMGYKRANAVREFLEENGIDGTIDIDVVSKGSKEPKYPNTTEENRIKNRRVEFILEY